VGVSNQEFGGVSAWLIHAINAITGNLDREGGAMFPLPAIDLPGLAPRLGLAGHFARYKSRVRGLPEFGGELPVATLAEEILTPGDKQIRALVTSAGNPVLSAPNGRQLDRALDSLDFMVSIDVYLNETTRHARVILPPSFGLEHDHYDLAFHMFSVRNTAKYSPALFSPGPDALHDWEIFLELTLRLSAKEGFLGELATKAKRWVGQQLPPHRLLGLALRLGPYGAGLNPLSKGGLTLGELRAHPHGVDLGAMRPMLPGRLSTKDKRVALAPEPMVADLARLERLLTQAPSQDGALSLIGRRELRSNNSWGHNSQRMVKGKERCTLRIHPRDAEARGLQAGARVRVRSRVGEVVAPVELTDELMPGVVSLPHGWGHDRDGARLSVAAQRPGVSINDLSDDARVDALSGNAAFSGTPVFISLFVSPLLTVSPESAS
jgi:anaerobic selenocysteine-containing dehydrogenase